MKNPFIRLIIFFGLVISILIVINKIESDSVVKTVGYKEFNSLVEGKQIVGTLLIQDDNTILGKYKEKEVEGVDLGVDPSGLKSFIYKVNLKLEPDVVSDLKKKEIGYTYSTKTDINWGFFLIILVVGFLLFRMLRGGASGMNGAGMLGKVGGNVFNKVTPEMINVTFADVEGVDEAKAELSEIVDYLRNPDKFKNLGAKVPRGVLLTGKPGTGKTMLAKALAKEAGVPFFYGSGSDFIEVFVGVGASRMRSLFQEARKSNPCILFIDEIDAIGAKRDAMGSNSERDQTINALLTEMDGFSTMGSNVIVIAATNRSEILDPALKRPGRFDREVNVPAPSMEGRRKILEIHTTKIRQIPLASDVDLEVIAKGTSGFTGAELENLVNESAIHAGRKMKTVVEMSDFEAAKDKIILGLENKGFKLTKEDKRRTAIHEAGHALLNVLYREELDTLHKVSIVPRGRALGVTMSLPDENKGLNYSLKKCEALIKMLLAGRVAEEIFYEGDINTGASNDIEKVTQLARSMVYSWGMSKLGPINFENINGDFKHHFSEQVRLKADEEIMNIVNRNYEKTIALITENRNKIEEITNLLIEKETIDGHEVTSIVLGNLV